jgi:FixJ family two-component response regulator
VGLISVVDDDESVRRTTKLLIESFGYRAVVFDSAETFLKPSQLNNTCCLVVDVKMPGMSGLQLQRRLSAERSSIPIIFISAYGNNESRREQLLESIRFALQPDKKDKTCSV